jgi:hypothetical protein
MKQLDKGKANYILPWLLTIFLVVVTANFIFALTFKNNNKIQLNVIASIDTLPQRDSSLSKKDSIKVAQIDTLNYKKSKDSLNAPVNYHADDSMVFDVPGKLLLLYGKKSNVIYQDNNLAAPYISFNQNTNIVSAYLQKDTAGKVLAFPTFNQADFKSMSDTIRFNMKTQKGITKGTYTKQGEMFVYGEKIKKTEPNSFYALRGRFTTCNLDTPHFAFVSSKVKMINKKMAITGPVHPEVEGVPLPIILPFGIYPLKQGRHSGFIAPNYTSNEQLGIALEGIGYYKILSDNWDIVGRGSIYSYGSWTASISPRYMKRYRYQGNFSLDVQSFKNGFKGDLDYSKSQTYNIRWSHSQDNKANPGVSFSANVNAGSSKFNSQVPNSPGRNFNNQLSSSITYAKVWKDKPFNLSVSANHNQNTTLKQINLNLPDVSFNVNTLYPFRKKESIGENKWFENIGIALNTNAKSQSSFYDTTGNFSKQLMDNYKWGASHSIPISLSLPAIGPLQVSPTVSYQERWYQEQFVRVWNPDKNKIDTIIKNGLYTARDMSFGIGTTTRIFGMFGFRKSSKVQAIRHEIRPSISASYKPNMNANSYYASQIDSFGRTQKFSYYERSIYGAFSDTKFAGLNFGIDNILQMKVKNGKDTSASSLNKVSLIDGLSINGNYNFLLDSFNLSNLSMSARSTLFNKINITASAVFDPYLYNNQGRRINKLIWTKKPFSLGTMTSGSVSMQSRFNGGGKNNPNSNVNTPVNNMNNNGMPMDEYQQEAAYIRSNPNEFVDFSAPWSFDFGYSLRFSKMPSYSGDGTFKTSFNQDVNWHGDFNLTPKWKLGASGSYNITLKEIGVLSLNLSRDLHCWQMSITMSPVGKYKFFTLNISPKSPILRDIKVNRTRYFYEL